MPHLEHELTNLSESLFRDFRFVAWILAVRAGERCPGTAIFSSTERNLLPTRVIHCATNAVTHPQSSLADILPTGMLATILYWLDDIMLHHSTVPGSLKAMGELFELCADRNINLHSRNCVLFATQTRWCGRLVSADGI